MFYFLTLAMLNLLDGLFTFWGLASNLITEANPFMRWMWTKSPWLFIGYKVFLSASLAILAFFFNRLSYQRLWGYGITVLNIVYGGVLIVHIYWVTNFFR